MILDMLILRPLPPVVAVWLARLADRVADLREQARLGVIEAVGRTTAEAVEWLLQSALDRPAWTMPEADDLDDEYDDPAVDDEPHRRPVSPRPSWCWRTVTATVLFAVRGWARYEPPQGSWTVGKRCILN